jgi:hypothetical protein
LGIIYNGWNMGEDATSDEIWRIFIADELQKIFITDGI